MTRQWVWLARKGDSQCYLGVAEKVEAIHQALKARIGTGPGQFRFRTGATGIHHRNL